MVATAAGAVDGATGGAVDLTAVDVVIGASVTTAVVELASTMDLDSSATGSASELHAVTAQVTATIVMMTRVTGMCMHSRTQRTPDANVRRPIG